MRLLFLALIKGACYKGVSPPYTIYIYKLFFFFFLKKKYREDGKEESVFLKSLGPEKKIIICMLSIYRNIRKKNSYLPNPTPLLFNQYNFIYNTTTFSTYNIILKLF